MFHSLIRKHTLHLLSLIVFTLFAASCNQESAPISFMVFGDAAEYQAYLELVAAFEESYPEIQVDVTHIPSQGDYRTRLATDFAAGSPPDISLINYRRFSAFAAANQLEPIGPYLANSSILHQDEYYAVALHAFTWDGQITCMPQNISSPVVYYNEALFDAAGLAYPPDKWTWDDFVNTAKALTLDTNGDGVVDQYGLGLDPSFIRLAPFVWQNNGPIVDNEGSPTRLTLTRFPSLEAFRWFVGLRQEHRVLPGREEEVAQDSESRFMAGTTAMYIDSRRVTPNFREIETFTWDVAPLPNGQTSANILHSDAYCLSRAAENKEAAWAFIEFANSVEGQTIIAKSGRTVPSLIAVSQSEAFLTPGVAPSRSQVWLDSVPVLRFTPVISTWDEIEAIAGEEIERAMYGEVDVETAANLAVQRTEEYFLIAASRNQ